MSQTGSKLLEVDDWHTPRAQQLDVQQVLAHRDTEPAILAPVRTPAVADDPVGRVRLFVHSPPSHFHGVLAQPLALAAREHSARVVQQGLRHVHHAADGAARVDLRLHVRSVLHVAILAHLHAAILLDSEAGLIRPAVLASIHRLAVLIDGLVDRAGLIGNSLAIGVGVHGIRKSASARAASRAVDDFLLREIDRRPLALAHQIDTVRKRGCGGLRPARSAVLRNVLVLVPRRVVVAVDVADVVALRKILRLDVGVRKRRLDHFLHSHLGIYRLVPANGSTQNAALREVVDSVLDSQRDRVRDLLLRDARNAVGASLLDSQIVLAAHNAEEALLAPVGSPAVANDPVRRSILFAPSHDADIVAVAGNSGLVFIDSSLVFQEIVGHVDRASDRSMRVDFLHDVLHALHMAVFLHVVLCVVMHRPATLRIAILADVNVVAHFVIASFVALATFFGDSHLVRILVDVNGQTSMAAIIDL